MTFTLQEDGASLSLSGGPSALGFDLSKVPGPEAASRLQALTLGLAERVCSLEQRLAGGREEEGKREEVAVLSSTNLQIQFKGG